MFDKIVDRFSGLAPNKYFFRLLTVFLLLVILATQFSWVESLLGRILNLPELRHQVILSTSSENEFRSASLIVVNLGFGAAKNVLIHVNAQHGNIARYRIDSQELYQIENIHLQGGVLDIWLDRIASGASVDIELAGTGLLTDCISLSATSDQGSSTTIDSPTLSGQVDTYMRRVAGLFSESGKIIGESASVRDIADWASTKPIFARTLQIVNSYEFQTVGVAALIVTYLIAIFFPYDYFVWGVPLIAGFIVWLFFDFPIRTWWVAAGIAIVFLLSVISVEVPDEWKWAELLVISGIGLLAVMWYWDDTMSGKWVLGATTSLVTLIIVALVSARPSSE